MVQTNQAVTILGSGDVSEKTLTKAMKLAPYLVCADGGADTAMKFGLKPNLIVGDFDSISDQALQYFDTVKKVNVQEQDSTDFDKCIRKVNAPSYVATGVIHPRIDHGLAAINALIRYQEKKISILTEMDFCFLAPSEISMKLPVGTRISLFPMSIVTGHSEGLQWPIDDLVFAPFQRIGTSNKTSYEDIYLNFGDPGMIIILPSEFADNVITAFIEATPWKDLFS